MKLCISGAMNQPDLFVEDGHFVESLDRTVCEIVDAEGLHVLPGMVDTHVHFREPGASHKETWETGSRAAALGGVTCVLDMPNTDPATVDMSRLDEKRRLVEGRSHVDFGFHLGASLNFEEMSNVQGVKAVKVYMGSSTGDLLVDQPSMWERIFRWAKDQNLIVIVHAEDERRMRERMSTRLDDTTPMAYAEARDCECAHLAVSAALELQKKVGNELHIAHVSCREELEALRMADSSHVSFEIAPHHLMFTMNDMQDARLKMNPPLRHEEDRVALWKALTEFENVMIATDHAPHTLEEKSQDIWKAPAGVPGVQFALPILLNAVNEGRLTLEKVVELYSARPARRFGLSQKGGFEPGKDADFVLVDLQKSHTVLRSDVASKCGWSPYEGFELKGWPVATYLRGEPADRLKGTFVYSFQA